MGCGEPGGEGQAVPRAQAHLLCSIQYCGPPRSRGPRRSPPPQVASSTPHSVSYTNPLRTN